MLDRAEAELEKETYGGTICFNDTRLDKASDSLLSCIEPKAEVFETAHPFADYTQLIGLIKKVGTKALVKKYKFDSLGWNSDKHADGTRVTFRGMGDEFTVRFSGKQQNNKIKSFLLALGEDINSNRRDETGSTNYLMANLEKYW